ncbi:MAG: hypothetical protein KME32_20830 [Mojavia pulchra JT2-VF2]|jgi:hypothetical protein|uniref:Primosomal protein n=1 Tax=Mojavia pulchra JT2-VF2 TaxID=287848 RepID=A0A951UIQ2_9NOST|nr:hypothetical protein [Mojavia pulchra JT2-VF2]
MARAIERIERDIALLKEAISAIAVELQSAYATYLSTLGQAIRQQLILATYHLCTQGYAENFLSLSLNQRQQLQQAIRNLGQEAVEQLLTSTRNEGEEVDEEDEGDEEDEEDEVAEVAEGDEVAQEDEPNPQSKNHLEELKLITEENLPMLKEALALRYGNFAPTIKLTDTSNPIELATWQQNLEKVIQHTLKKVSHDANGVLQKAGILPKKLPEPILEVAAAASEASAEVIPGPPNLLNLVIEIENERDAQESSLTRIMAINLRLGEIEFADAKLSSERKHIRSILLQLNKLGQEYQKKQRERSIAEAEAAWRAIWVDD